VLLIVAALDYSRLLDLHALAVRLGLDVLVEVHDEAELDLALATPAPLIGINNRDLRTFETSLDTTIRLSKRVPFDRIVVSESGIRSRRMWRASAPPACTRSWWAKRHARQDPATALWHLFFSATE
jgi:indole-3-glycerol phosphate synthase